MIPINKKLVLVTGASRGIGKEISIALLKEGYFVACGYNKHKVGILEIEKKYTDAYGIKIDIRNRQSVRRAIVSIEKRFKQTVDIVINNAGIADEKPFESITDTDWDNMLEVNLRGPFVVSQEVLPSMVNKRWGRIVNVSSIGGQWGGMNQVHYAAAKAGVINLTRSLAKLYSRYGITSNAVAPGLVDTDMIKKEITSKVGKEKIAQIPVGRIGTPHEVAAAVVFLCSDDAAYITGHTININGGLLF